MTVPYPPRSFRPAPSVGARDLTQMDNPFGENGPVSTPQPSPDTRNLVVALRGVAAARRTWALSGGRRPVLVGRGNRPPDRKPWTRRVAGRTASRSPEVRRGPRGRQSSGAGVSSRRRSPRLPPRVLLTLSRSPGGAAGRPARRERSRRRDRWPSPPVSRSRAVPRRCGGLCGVADQARSWRLDGRPFDDPKRR